MCFYISDTISFSPMTLPENLRESIDFSKIAIPGAKATPASPACERVTGPQPRGRVWVADAGSAGAGGLSKVRPLMPPGAPKQASRDRVLTPPLLANPWASWLRTVTQLTRTHALPCWATSEPHRYLGGKRDQASKLGSSTPT